MNNNIKNLVGKNVLVNSVWFMPKVEDLCNFKQFKVLSVDESTGKLEIDEVSPYAKQNDKIKLSKVVNNYDKMEEMIKLAFSRRFSDVDWKDYYIRAIYSDKSKDKELKIDLYYKKLLKDDGIIEDLDNDGKFISRIGKSGKVTIIAVSINELMDVLKKYKILDDIFSSMSNIGQQTVSNKNIKPLSEKEKVKMSRFIHTSQLIGYESKIIDTPEFGTVIEIILAGSKFYLREDFIYDYGKKIEVKPHKKSKDTLFYYIKESLRFKNHSQVKDLLSYAKFINDLYITAFDLRRRLVDNEDEAKKQLKIYIDTFNRQK